LALTVACGDGEQIVTGHDARWEGGYDHRGVGTDDCQGTKLAERDHKRTRSEIEVLTHDRDTRGVIRIIHEHFGDVEMSSWWTWLCCKRRLPNHHYRNHREKHSAYHRYALHRAHLLVCM
jgi:hypothetical protein